MASTSFGYGSKSSEIAQTGILVNENGLERDDIKNYIVNGHFELDTLGWSASGTATLARTTTTAELVRGVASLKMTTGAVGNYIAYPFTIDPIDKSQTVYIQFNYLPLAGYVSGDFTCVLHDGTNEIALSGVGTIPSTGVLYVGNATLTTSSTYELRFKSAATAGRSVCIDRIMVGGMPNMNTAANITNTPAGNLIATTVQSALNELQGDIDTINTGGSLTNATLAGTVTVSGGTASTWVYLNGTKQLTSFVSATRALLTDGLGNFTTLPYSSASAISSIPQRDASGNSGFNKLSVAAGNLGGFDVTAAGDMYIGASVGLNKVYLGGTASTYRLVGITSTGIAHINTSGDVTSSLIVAADIAAGAAIERNKLSSGTASHVVINDVAGVMSSEATLAVARGGTNIASYGVGDILYASATGVLAKLPIGISGQFLQVSGLTVPSWVTTSGLGDVFGPASSADNAVTRFDATTGKLLQNSVVTIGDLGEVAGITTLSASGLATLNSASITTTLGVTGALSGTAASFSTTLAVTGATSLASTLAVNGVATIGPSAVASYAPIGHAIYGGTGVYIGDGTATALGSISLRRNEGSGTTGVELHIRPNSGYKGYLSFTESGVADRWALGIQPSDGTFYFRPGISTATPVGTISSSGAWTLGPSTGATSLTHTLQSGAVTEVKTSSGALANAVFHSLFTGTTRKSTWGVAGVTNDFITGAAAGETVIRADGSSILFSANSGSTLQGKLDTNGAWTLGPSTGAAYHVIQQGSSDTLTLKSTASASRVNLLFDVQGVAKAYVGVPRNAGELCTSAAVDDFVFRNQTAARGFIWAGSTGNITANLTSTGALDLQDGIATGNGGSGHRIKWRLFTGALASGAGITLTVGGTIYSQTGRYCDDGVNYYSIRTQGTTFAYWNTSASLTSTQLYNNTGATIAYYATIMYI